MKIFSALLSIVCFSFPAFATHPATTVLDANLGVSIGEQASGHRCRLETTVDNGRHKMTLEYTHADKETEYLVEFTLKDLFTNPELPFFVAQHNTFRDPTFTFSYDKNLRFERIKIQSAIIAKDIAECYMPTLLEKRSQVNYILEKNLGVQIGVDDQGESCELELANLSMFVNDASTSYVDANGNSKTISADAINFRLGKEDSVYAMIDYKMINETYLKIRFDENQEAISYELSRFSVFGKKKKLLKKCQLQ